MQGKLLCLVALGWLCTANATNVSQTSFDDENFQLDDDGYVSNQQENTDTYFEDGLQQLAYHSAKQRLGTGRSSLIFSPRKLRWFAYDGNGNLIGSGRASGGRGYCADIRRSCRTPVGSFKINSMGSASCYSTKYPVGRGGAPMPYCMFFRGGYAIHGSNDVPNYNASHGCIRVEPSAARWLRYNVLRVGSRVIVEPY